MVLHTKPSHIIHHRIGGWLPKDHRILHAWLTKKKAEAKARRTDPSAWAPVIKEFRALIEGDSEIYMGFNLMFDEVPDKPPYNKDPTGTKQVCGPQLVCDILKN
jgi:phosphatidylserine decarboxylase